MYPLTQPRTSEVRWDGPDCVKNLFLDTVNQCPPEEKKEEKKEESKKGKALRRRLR